MSTVFLRQETMMRTPTRIFLGCVAGSVSVLMFHQTTLQFFWLGWAPMAAFRIAQVPPFSAPLVVSITFWGAVYGGVFALVVPHARGPLWLKGMIAGVMATGMAWFVFLPLMGRHAAFGWHVWPMLRTFVAYQMWGLGLSVLLPRLYPRRLDGGTRRLDGPSLAA
jgi:hypothetical protein